MTNIKRLAPVEPDEDTDTAYFTQLDIDGVITGIAEMAALTKSFALDEENDKGVRVGAAIATGKLLASAVPALKVRNDLFSEDLSFIRRALGDGVGQDLTGRLRHRRAVALAEQHAERTGVKVTVREPERKLLE
ncbi:hypothetical protein GS636_21455 [Ruegeria sp. HKCCD4884]|uniref:hypothetical protein n=1 Tax=Ruegeria sp. HKCCD4884 TaxID=2683022 RepID=UPI001492881E|nr:hypothetical protein [Ruegeria sp. HKCCD4884]NOD95373.1 hypothetical protein [Ruegeria sp. HKCCD4884]